MTGYTSDAPDISDNTNVDELIKYTESRIENPIVMDDTTIYHFNSHEVDMDALEDAVENKLQRNLYQIPLQIHSGNVLIQSILPRKILEAEILIYREDQNEYYGYKNLIRDIPVESRQRIREDFADIIKEHL